MTPLNGGKSISCIFEDIVKEEETEEGRGAAKFSEDRGGPNAARTPPTLQLARNKACGGVVSTTRLGGGKDS